MRSAARSARCSDPRPPSAGPPGSFNDSKPPGTGVEMVTVTHSTATPSDPARDALPPQAVEEMRAEADHELNRRARAAGIPYPVLIVVFAALTRMRDDHPGLLLAAGVVFTAIGLYRFVLSRAFAEGRIPDRVSWGRRFALATYATAATWALFAAATIVSYGSAWETTLIVVVTLGIGSAAVTALSASLRLTRGFLLILTSPVIGLLPFVGGPHGVTLSVLHAVYVVFLLGQSRGHNRQFWRTLEDTHLLAQRSIELERARAAAEAASETKSAFLRNMSHELRTPMNAILGMARLALDTKLDDEQQEYLVSVERAGENLMSLVNEVLDYARLDAGNLVLEENPYRLRDEIHRAVSTLAPLAYRHGLDLSVCVAPDVPETVVGDDGRLRQILSHLVDNAIKFTREGEVVVRVGVASTEDGRARIRFSVRDTGIGIPEADQARIFEAFSQADASTTRVHGGTGLGLSLCAALVRVMAGTLSVTSEPGQGSEFSFTIPLAVEEDGGVPELSADVRGARVLVLERGRTGREHLAELLGAWGLEAVVVDDADAAREAAREAGRTSRPFGAAVLAPEAVPPHEVAALTSTMESAGGLAGRTLLLLPPGASLPDVRWDPARVAGAISRPVRASDLLDRLVEVLAADVVDAALPPEVGTDGSEPGSRILLVEDNHVNRLLAVRLLERGGYSVDVAVNGIEAVDRSSRETFGLILMDVSMPEMDGIEATEVIRAREATTGRHVPIVALTAHAMTEDRERCLAAGMDEHVAKPIVADVLLATVARYVGPPPASDETPGVAA